MSSRCRNRRLLAVVLALSLGACAAACERAGEPTPRTSGPSGARAEAVPQIPLRPGYPVVQRPVAPNPFGGDPHAIKEGQRLYNWMNCSGCHFEGGGGIGPPLMDDEWIYGGRPEQIFDTIVNGRANGMPAYGEKLVIDEIWRIVAYVQTLNPDAGRGGGQGVGRTRQGGSGSTAGTRQGGSGR